MKFTQTNFNDLVASITEAQTKLLLHHQVKTEKELPDTRRHELAFLMTIVDEAKKLTVTEGSYARHFSVILGALLVVQNDIEANLKVLQGSYLDTLIKDVIDKHMIPKAVAKAPVIAAAKPLPKATAKPTAAAAKPTAAAAPAPAVARELTAYQRHSAHYSLNDFLQAIIYKKGNPAEGYEAQNPFITAKIPLKTLQSFLLTSYKLQPETNLKKKPLDSGQPTNGNDVRIFTDVSQVTLDWSDLLKAFDELKRTETVANKKASITQLPLPRSTQLCFLDELAKNLHSTNPWKNKDKECAAIFAGALLLVREEINIQYKYKTLFNKDAKTTSKVHTGISDMLKVSTLTEEQARVLMTSTQHYMIQMCYERTDSTLAPTVESIRGPHLFSTIPGFSLAPLMNIMEQFINHCRTETLKDNIKQLQKLTGTDKPSSGVMGLLSVGGWFGKKPAASVDLAPAATDDAADDAADAIAAAPETNGSAAASATATATPAAKPTTGAAKSAPGAAKSATGAAKSTTGTVVKLSTNKNAFQAPKPISGSGTATGIIVTVDDKYDLGNHDLSYKAAKK